MKLIIVISAFVFFALSPIANAATIEGTNGPDLLKGTSDGDIIYGYGGDDSIHGRGGLDSMYGGGGDDVIISGKGAYDKLFGGAGQDFLDGATNNCNKNKRDFWGGDGEDYAHAFKGVGNLFNSVEHIIYVTSC